MSEDDSSQSATEYYDEKQDYSADEITVTDASSLINTVGSTAAGNFMEWFDFGVYSYVVMIISDQFFPQSGWATVATFGGLAVSFLLRPLGGFFWGILADRIGRKKVLAATVTLMAIGTCALGVVPGYARIGIWAPILLFLLRGVQGFSTGGEYVDAMTFLVEHSPDNKRGYLCSFLPTGTLLGYISGALIVILMKGLLGHDAMHLWGWRIPFLLAGPLGMVVLYMRLHMEETPAYKNQSEDDRMQNKGAAKQLKQTLLGQWRPILVCMGLVLTFNVTNYMLTGYMPTFLPKHLGVPDQKALIIIVLVMAVLAVMVTFLGKLGDHVGRKPIMLAGSILLIVVSVPMFLLMFKGGKGFIFLGTLPMGLMLVCFLSTEPSTLPTLFPTNVRSGATAIAFNISVSLFGGTTPLVAAALVEGTDDLLMPAYMLIVAGVVGVVSLIFTREPVGKSLQGAAPVVEDEQAAQELAEDSGRGNDASEA